MAYVNWVKIYRDLFPIWLESQYLWCTSVQADTSVVSQLQRHYREQVILSRRSQC